MKVNYDLSTIKQPVNTIKTPTSKQQSNIALNQNKEIQDKIAVNPRLNPLKSVSVSNELTQLQSNIFAKLLDKAFVNAEKFQVKQNILTSLPENPLTNTTYVHQYGYHQTKVPQLLRTGPISACIVVTIYNENTKHGAMCHLARENVDYTFASLAKVGSQGSSFKLKDGDCFQRLLSFVSGGDASKAQVNIIGSNDGAMSFWKKYVSLLGCNNIQTHFYKGWMENIATGYGDELLDDIKSKDIAKGFVQFSSIDGSVAVSENPDQFKGNTEFVGAFENSKVPLLKNIDLINFYKTNSVKLGISYSGFMDRFINCFKVI